MSKPVWTNEQITNQLLRDDYQWQRNVLYQFASSFNAAEKGATTLAFQYVADIINLKFTEAAYSSSLDGRISFSNASLGAGLWGDTHWTYFTNQVNGHYPVSHAEVQVNTMYSGVTSNYAFGSYDFFSMFHEIGHSLGEDHPGTYGEGGATYAANAIYFQDSRQYTVMSYFEATNTGGNHHGYYASTPLLHDVMALQALYGANMTTRTGNTTYGFNNNSGRDAFDFNIDSHPVVAIWDAGGTDTIDLSGYSAPCKLDLNQGAFSDVGGLQSNLSICYNAVIENGVGGTDDDQIIGNSANNSLYGGHGNDILTAGTGSDMLDGGVGDDTLNFGASFGSGDSAVGGDGTDTLALSGNYGSLAFAAGSLSGIEVVSLAAGGSYNFTLSGIGGAGVIVTFDGSQLASGDGFSLDGSLDTSGPLTVIGGAGTDDLTGTSGNDIFQFGSGFSALDSLDGGGGTDTLLLNGNLGALNFGVTTMTNVETLKFGAGFSYNVSLNNANVTSGTTLTVDGSALGASDTLAFSAATDTDSTFIIVGGAGANTLTGGGLADTINGGAGNDVLAGGNGDDALVAGTGNDRLNGGNGNDTLKFDANLTTADAIDGGGGTDTVTLNGDYTLAFSPTMMVNVETLSLATAHNYTLTLNDATVVGGATLTVDGSALGVVAKLVLDASAELDGNVAALGGAGSDTFTFGAGLAASDQISGGAGSDTLVLVGNATAVFNATTMTGIETMRFTSGHSYDLTLNNANVAAGATLTVDASALLAADSLKFNALADTDSAFSFTGGAGTDNVSGGAMNDTLVGGTGNDRLDGRDGNDLLTAGTGTDTLLGGNGNDSFIFGANFTAADTVDGGAGTDTLALDGNYAVVMAAASLAGIETITVAAGHSYSLTFNNANVAANARLTVDGSALGATDKLTLDASAELDGKMTFTGGAADDVLTGGNNWDTLVGGAGNDALYGGGAHDTLAGGMGADLLNGGTGADVFVYNAVAESTSTNYDKLVGFDATGDNLDIFGTVNAIDAAVATKKVAISAATFDSDLSHWADASHLHAGDAVVVTAKGGTLKGESFLVVDCNGKAGYQAGADLVFDLHAASHLAGLSTATFI